MQIRVVKPTLGFVTNSKPVAGRVVNTVPSISRIYGEEVIYKYIYRGMPIGLLLTLTYPETYRT